MLKPENIEDVQDAVRSCEKAIPVAGLTKPALTQVPDDFEHISTLGLNGVVEYDPSEFTITVLAGTSISNVQEVLNEQGQYLPFDPPLGSDGATIGGTVAAGLSGPGAYRFGPIRDFLIGLRYVDGDGKSIIGGGKVVKNAAGFDTPKYLIGSIGRLGIMVELTFKVFPAPETRSTFSIEVKDSPRAIELITQLSRSTFDLEAIEYIPDAQLLIGRLAGNLEAIEKRLLRIDEALKLREPLTVLNPFEADAFWGEHLNFSWIESDLAVAKYAITPGAINKHDSWMQIAECRRRYSIGGNTAWINAPIDLLTNEDKLQTPGLLIRKPETHYPVWTRLPKSASKIQSSLKQAMDAPGKFPPLYGTTPSPPLTETQSLT